MVQLSGFCGEVSNFVCPKKGNEAGLEHKSYM